MKQIEYACKDVVFHFNKKHLEDQTIPMWVLKTHGESYYVHHVDCQIPWSTKETPDNSHTKGSLKIKDCLLTIDPETNEATVTKLTLFDKIRLRNQRLGIHRIMFHQGSFENALKQYKHSPFKRIYGSCGSSYTVCDILDPADMTMLALTNPGKYRVLMPNEVQYQAYDDKGLWSKLQASFDADEYADDEDEE